MEQSSDTARVVVPEKRQVSGMAVAICALSVFLVGLVCLYIYFLRLSADGQQRLASPSPAVNPQSSKEGKPIRPGARGLAQEDDYLIRATIEKLTGNSMELLMELGGVKRLTIPLTKDAFYGCQVRYIIDQKGRRVDRAEIWIDTSSLKASTAAIPPPGSKTLEWFTSTAKINDLVEVINVPVEGGGVKLYSVRIFRDNCQSL